MEQLAMHQPRNLINGNRGRAFSDRTVEPEKLRCLLEGASRTPSYLNEQPWNFIIATQGDSIEYERLVSCLSEVNLEWARRAPVLMLLVVRLNSGSNGARNTHAFRDSRHAVSNLLLRAEAMGLTAEQMAGFDAAKARAQFQIPAGFEPTAAIAVGYPTDIRGVSVPSQNGAISSNRPFESFVFTGSWGQPSLLINEPTLEMRSRESDCKGTADRLSSAA
ncbi:MAG TPA: nitroreductase family protein [Blastocatellia bacterium]|nr:nitroreductase family protein [Blastocatellia bacterium]